MIKMVLALRHGVLPRDAARRTSRRRRWTGRRARCELLTEARAWPRDRPSAPGRGVVVRGQRHQRARDPGGGAGRRGAGVDDDRPAPPASCRGCCPARCRAALRGAGRRGWPAAGLRARVASADVAGSLVSTSRGRFEHRAVVVGRAVTEEAAGGGWPRWLAGSAAPGVVTGRRGGAGQVGVRVPGSGIAVGRDGP